MAEYITDAATAMRRFAGELGITTMNESAASLSPPLRELHMRILSAFADTGAAPDRAQITDRCTDLGLDPDQALATLAEKDLVHTAAGAVTVAYPFSGTPTPHRVQFDDGPAVWAMCAADALGIAPMTGRDLAISSSDPHTGEPIAIRWRHGTWTWSPDSTVMLAAGTTGCCTGAEACCRHVNFFTRTEHAEAYLQANPSLTGQLHGQAEAIEVGRLIFGALLGRAQHLQPAAPTSAEEAWAATPEAAP